MNRRGFLHTAALGSLALVTPSLFSADRKKKLVLLAGSPSHGPGDHEFNAGVYVLAKCLAKVEGLTVETHTNGWPKDEKTLEDADGILIYADGGGGHPFLRKERLPVVTKLMAKGVGLMCAHYGVEVPADLGGKEFKSWIGGHYEHMFSVNPMWEPEFKEFPEHPITRGVKPFQVRDEWYFNMRFRDDMKGVTPILSAKPSDMVRKGPYVYPKGPYDHIVKESGRAEHMMWCVEREDGGRGVGFTSGHHHKNWKDDNFRKVVLNALLWICKIEVPKNGVESEATDDDMKAKLDDKTPKKK